MVVCWVAFPKVHRTILGVVDALDAIEALFYAVLGLGIVCVVSWALAYGLWRLFSGLTRFRLLVQRQRVKAVT